jgi:valyl-tRNA synthetase
VIGVIGFNNKMTEAAGKFAGLKFSEAREEVVKALREKDLLVKVKNYKHQVGHSERSGAMIQPQYSLQWFVKVEKLVEPAIKAIKDKEIKIVPTRFEKMSIQWLENLRDWCISRQLWWGHQIPVWYKSLDGMSELQRRMNPDLMEKYKHTLGDGNTKYVVSLEKPKGEWIQDPDTLDTWFSSAQWPFTILDYPDGADFKKFYPNSVMETGYDILNVWVTKMIMMGIYRTGKIPFKKVYLHGLVQDAKGQKMSKSKGNVVNPLELVEKYGADGLRMALIVGATPGNDVSLGEDKVKGYRNFANKIWNMTRFILMNAEGENIPAVEDLSSKLKGEDKKFLEKVEKTVKKVTNYLEKDQYSLAGEYLYAFIWHEFADQYIETSKDKLKSGNLETLAVLMYSLKTCLKLLHPYMPFVTERIWKEVRSPQEKDLIVTAWPK